MIEKTLFFSAFCFSNHEKTILLCPWFKQSSLVEFLWWR